MSPWVVTLMFFSVTCDVFFCHLKVEALALRRKKLSPEGRVVVTSVAKVVT